MPLRAELPISFLEEILDGTAKNSGDAIKRFGAGLVDVFVSLLIHLDGAETDAGTFCELGLGVAIGRADALQVRILKVGSNQFIRDIGEFGYIGLVKCVIHALQIIERENRKDIAEAS